MLKAEKIETGIESAMKNTRLKLRRKNQRTIIASMPPSIASLTICDMLLLI